MPPFSPLTSCLLRAGILLVLLAVACWWPPIRHAPEAKPPQSVVDPPVVDFAASEDAVISAFERFAAEQHADGSWGARDDAGEAIEPATTETTSLVLLAFASAGQTHRQGKYQDQVQRGLDYLLNAGKVDDELRPRRLMLPGRGHTTRSQALATRAIGELYFMTQDSQWQRASQFATNELCEPVHWPPDSPAEAADYAVHENVFWQRLALAHTFWSGIPVSREPILEAIRAFGRWYKAQPPASTETRWFGNDYIGLHTFRYRPREEIEAQFVRLTELPYESLPVAEQFCAGEALRLSYYSEAGPAIRRLKNVVLSQFTTGANLEEMAIRVMVLQTRLPKFIRSLNAPEDDFPLMTKHEDL